MRAIFWRFPPDCEILTLAFIVLHFAGDIHTLSTCALTSVDISLLLRLLINSLYE